MNNASNGSSMSWLSYPQPTELNTLHENNTRYNHTTNNQVSDINYTLALVAVSLLCTTGALTLLLNSLLFLATRYVTTDRNSTIVVVANMCVGEIMAGMFALAKTAFLFVHPAWVNCFLWESLLFTSIVMSSILQPCFAWNTFKQLGATSTTINATKSKRSMVISMVFLWDGAVIIGFIPLMGLNRWNIMERKDHTCQFFFFYYAQYLVIISVIVILGLTVSVLLNLILYMRERVLKKKLESDGGLTLAMHFNRYQLAARTCRYSCINQVILFTPLIVFIMIQCRSDIVKELKEDNSDLYLLFLISVLLLKSIISPFILGKGIPQIFIVIKRAWSFKLNSSAFTCCALEEGTAPQIATQTNSQRAQQTSISAISHPTASVSRQQNNAIPSIPEEPGSAVSLSGVRVNSFNYSRRRKESAISVLTTSSCVSASSEQAGCQACTKCGFINKAFMRDSQRSLTQITHSIQEAQQKTTRNSKQLFKDFVPLSQGIVNPNCLVHGNKPNERQSTKSNN